MGEIPNLRGSALMLAGQHQAAVASYTRAVDQLPSPESYTNLASAYMALEQWDDAARCVDVALKYDPGFRKAVRAREYLQESGNQ
jgi:tetratricopeptide (TPR) repeat protein